MTAVAPSVATAICGATALTAIPSAPSSVANASVSRLSDAELGGDPFDQAGPVARRVGEIGDDRERDASVGRDAGGHLLEGSREVPARAGFEAARDDRNPRTLRREPARDGRADAPARPGDD